MPAWYRQAGWVRGELASEDDGSLHVAAIAELFSVGRHDHAHGCAADSHARAFAKAVEAAAERANLAAGDTRGRS